MTHDTGFHRISQMYFNLCRAVDSPLSRHAAGLLGRNSKESLRALVDLTVDPTCYADAHSFQLDYLVTEVLSKYKGFDTGIDKKGVAISKFKAAEEQCNCANERFRLAKLRGFSPRVEAVLFTAQRKIASLLGDVHAVKLQSCMWGPGVTTTVKGSTCTMAAKIAEFPLSVSPGALPYMRNVLGVDIHLAQAIGIEAHGPFSPLPNCFKIRKYCKVTTVPKSAKTDRTIAVEPTCNIFLQKGIGSYIRKRLRTRNIDLNDQTINQRLAKEGSLTGRLATVDLSAASDTVSRGLVEALLPLDWYLMLDAIRSQYYLLDKEIHRFEKFSTMGNGFTFELESAIFWALAQSVADLEEDSETVSVYGDDIILGVKSLPLLRLVFDSIGLTINEKKTHSVGVFRESCGKHYFAGVDVTPFYQKEVPNVLAEIYRLANRIRRYAFSMGSDRVCLSEFHSCWLAAVRGVSIQHVIPLGEIVNDPLWDTTDYELLVQNSGDDGLALSFEELAPFIKPLGHGAYSLPVLKWIGNEISDVTGERCGPSGLAYWMRSRGSNVLTTNVRALRREGRWINTHRTFTSTLTCSWM